MSAKGEGFTCERHPANRNKKVRRARNAPLHGEEEWVPFTRGESLGLTLREALKTSGGKFGTVEDPVSHKSIER